MVDDGCDSKLLVVVSRKTFAIKRTRLELKGYEEKCESGNKWGSCPVCGATVAVLAPVDPDWCPT